MVVLGVVLVLLAFAAGVLLVAGVASLEGTIDVSVPGGTLSLPPLTFLVTGMVVISVFWLGWVVLRTGVRQGRRRRAEAKEAEARRVAEEQRLKEEFAARERQLIEERRRHDAETAELTRGADAAAPGVTRADATPTDLTRADATREDATRESTSHTSADTGTDARVDAPVDAQQGEHVEPSGTREEPGQDTGHGPRA